MLLLTTFIGALLINNIILMRFLGLCSFFGISQKLETSIGMGMAVTFVTVMATAATWPIYMFILVPFNLVYLRTAVFILVIAGLVQLVELFLRKSVPTLYRALGIYLPLITTNCLILAVTFLMIDNNMGLFQSLIYAVAVSLGYGLAIILFSAMQQRILVAPIPKSFRGYPVIFVLAALFSLAFMGFANLFGL